MKFLVLGIFLWFFTGWIVTLIRKVMWRKLIITHNGEPVSAGQMLGIMFFFPFQSLCIWWDQLFHGAAYTTALPIIPHLSPFGFGSDAPFGMMELDYEREAIVQCALGKKKYYIRHTVLGIPVRVPWDAESFFFRHQVDSVCLGLFHLISFAICFPLTCVITLLMIVYTLTFSKTQ